MWDVSPGPALEWRIGTVAEEDCWLDTDISASFCSRRASSSSFHSCCSVGLRGQINVLAVVVVVVVVEGQDEGS